MIRKRWLTIVVVVLLGAAVPSGAFAVAPVVSVGDPLPAAAECPSGAFLDVSTYQPKGYPAPELSVTCDEAMMTVRSNGIPNYEFVQITPNALKAQNLTYRIPLTPTVAATPGKLPLLGSVAVAINGMMITGPNEAQDLGFGDPYLDGLLDFCGGHTAPGGIYHLHAQPVCLLPAEGKPTNKILGYSFDGYAIYAPYLCADAACTNVQVVRSSWQRTKNVKAAWEAHSYVAGSGDLDQCNGMMMPDGSYRYFATATFPYFMGCYHGTATGGSDAPMNPGNAGGGGQAGGPGGGNPPSGGGGGNPPPPPPGGGGRPPRR
ncbi:MAG TPA: YHYH protein [Aggregatilineales bacterium]|nr:YHYH protein [Anaerolineales bacterium]HRE46698.1 YHYH protein [Aggregatilineales bacterium]